RGGRPPGRSVRIAVSRSGRTPPPCGCTRRPTRGSPRSRSRTRRQEASRDKGFAPQGFMMASKVALPVGELVPRFKEEQVFIIEAFLVHCLRESGRKGVVLGLSGGVDSALVAKLCADALGPQRVLAVAMPDGRCGIPPNRGSVQDAGAGNSTLPGPPAGDRREGADRGAVTQSDRRRGTRDLVRRTGSHPPRD